MEILNDILKWLRDNPLIMIIVALICFILLFVIAFILYLMITECLDLVFNSSKINNLLKHSDNIDLKPLEKELLLAKELQKNLCSSYLYELKINKMRNNEKVKEVFNIFRAK